MPEFIDCYLDELVLSSPFSGGPAFSTTMSAAASGAETRNQNWTHPLRKFVNPECIREQPTLEAVQAQWLVTAGPFRTFPFQNPLDYASCPLAEGPWPAPVTISPEDQFIATADGFTASFPLQKTYVRNLNGGGQATYTRPIYLPQLDTVTVAILFEGVYYSPEDVPSVPLAGGPYVLVSTSRPGGVLTFDKPLAEGLEVWAGYLYDELVRFEADDSFDAIVQSYLVSGYASLTLQEVRPC